MKKIVSILAAAAVLATSVFAADVSAAIQGYGDLFCFSTAEGSKAQILGWNDPWDREFAWYSTGIGFNFNGDKAGLAFELDNEDVTVKHSKFWIQPLDMLKITLGDNTIEMDKETIDYEGTVFTASFEGWVFDLTPAEGFAIQLGLVTGAPAGWSTNYWIGQKNYDGGDSMGEVLATVSYKADFGAIKALYDLNNKANTFGIDYVGNFGATMVSPAVAYALDAKTLFADLYVTTAAGPVGINVYGLVTLPNEADTTVTVNTKFSYGISAGTLSLQLKDTDVLADQFAMMAKVNLACNCGSAGLDLGLQFDVADTVKISLPFQYNIHF